MHRSGIPLVQPFATEAASSLVDKGVLPADFSETAADQLVVTFEQDAAMRYYARERA